MNKKILSGKVITNMKKSLDNSKVVYSGEMCMTEKQFKEIGRILGKTQEEIEKSLGNLLSLDINELDEKL